MAILPTIKTGINALINLPNQSSGQPPSLAPYASKSVPQPTVAKTAAPAIAAAQKSAAVSLPAANAPKPIAPAPAPTLPPALGLPGGADPAMQVTGPTNGSAPAPLPDPYREAQAAYLASLGPSPDVTSATQAIGGVSAKEAQDVAAAQQAYAQRVGAINEQATLQPFLTGRQAQAGSELANQMAAIQAASGAQTLPLQQRLAQAQAAQQSQQAQAEAKLGFATPKARVAPVELSAGSQLVDPVTGKTIASTPAKQDFAGPVGEYQFYAQQEQKAGRSPLTFDAYQTRDANRKAKAASAGVSTGASSLVSTIISNPELFSQLTPTQKAQVAPALNAMGFTAFGKPMSDTAIKDITQSETAIESLNELKSKVQANLQYIGPISGLAAYNPYSKAKQVQSDINLVKQQVGKALEGGVLRKEDEEKYKQILATITDTPENAIYKINQLVASVQRQVDSYKKGQALGGREVGTTAAPSSGTTQGGVSYTIEP